MLPLRDENPTSGPTWVTWLLMAACVAVFVLAQTGLGGVETVETAEGPIRIDEELGFSLANAVIPCEVTTGDPLSIEEVDATFNGGDASACSDDDTGPELFPDKNPFLALLSSMFLHGGLAHLGGNVWFLHLFGNNIEDRLGHLRYLAFYLVGGVVATAGHILVDPDSTIPLVGASGAIAAIMGAYLVWHPDAPIRTWIFLVVLDIRARWFLGAWFVMQFFTGSGSGVAWVAHVAGFVFGAVGGLLLRRGEPERWDPTGGAGHGPYPHPIEYLEERRTPPPPSAGRT